MKAKIKKLGELHLKHNLVGNHTLNLFPDRLLPSGFEMFQPVVDKIFSHIPWDNNSSNDHFVTIDSKYFAEASALRREGLHIDGNFCADPEFQLTGSGRNTWGGTEIIVTWGRTRFEVIENGNYSIHTPFINEFGAKPEVGIYVSEELGGIFCVSDLAGCEAFEGDFDIEVQSEGNVEHERKEIEKNGNKILFQAHQLYFMTSNTPHESLIIPAGNRRTLIRVTLAHDYPNKLLKL